METLTKNGLNDHIYKMHWAFSIFHDLYLEQIYETEHRLPRLQKEKKWRHFYVVDHFERTHDLI